MLPQRDGGPGRTEHSPHGFPTPEACGNWLIRGWSPLRFECGPCTESVERVAGRLFGHCSEVCGNPSKRVRKMSENQNESCADLGKRSAVILHSSESGIEQPVQIVRQADSDDQLIGLWLHGRPEHTQRAYRAEVDRFILYVDKPLAVGEAGRHSGIRRPPERVRPQTLVRPSGDVGSQEPVRLWLPTWLSPIRCWPCH